MDSWFWSHDVTRLTVKCKCPIRNAHLMTEIRLWGRRLFGAICIPVHCPLAYGKDLASSRRVDNEGENRSKSCMAWELRLSVIIQIHCTSEKSRIFSFNISIMNLITP
jgi:hypothetical protein